MTLSHHVIDRIYRDFEVAHIDRVMRYIAQPSISALNLGVRDMADMLASDIVHLGGTSNVVETSEFPVVFGRIDEGAEKTLLFHGLYDVTPADEDAWVVSPFEPDIRDLAGIGRSIVGRGAEDMKTPIAAMINTIASYRATGHPLPVNLIIVLEASELGSGGVREFVASRADELRKSDAVLWLCPMAHPNGVPIVPLSVKGNLMGRLICSGGKWGGPIGSEMHGLNSNWIGNPAVRLSECVALLENHLEIDYVNGKGWQPTDSQRHLARELTARLDEGQLKTELGIRSFRYKNFEDSVFAHLFRPQFTVTGMHSGFVGEGKSVKVSIPSSAQAVVNMRFQPGQDPESGIAQIRRILDHAGFSDIQFEVNNAYAGGGSSPEDPIVKCVLNVHSEMGLEPEVWPVHPIAIPVAIWTDYLKLPWIGGVPCHAGNKHAANEYVQVDSIRKSEEFLVRLMDRISESDL